MIYNHAFCVPAMMGALDLYKRDMKLTRGVLHKYEVVFPPGCVGLVGVAVYQGVHQVFPTNPNEMFWGDGETLSFREHLPLMTDPYVLTAYLVNIDDTFAHTITFRLGILPVEVVAPWLLSYEERLAAALGSAS